MTTCVCKHTMRVYCWEPTFCCKLHYLCSPSHEHALREHGEGTYSSSCHRCEGVLDLLGFLHVQHLKLHSQRTRYGLDFFYRFLSINIFYVCKNCYPRDSWNYLFE